MWAYWRGSPEVEARLIAAAESYFFTAWTHPAMYRLSEWRYRQPDGMVAYCWVEPVGEVERGLIEVRAWGWIVGGEAPAPVELDPLDITVFVLRLGLLLTRDQEWEGWARRFLSFPIKQSADAAEALYERLAPRQREFLRGPAEALTEVESPENAAAWLMFRGVEMVLRLYRPGFCLGKDIIDPRSMQALGEEVVHLLDGAWATGKGLMTLADYDRAVYTTWGLPGPATEGVKS